jgi:hypothetical protein
MGMSLPISFTLWQPFKHLNKENLYCFTTIITLWHGFLLEMRWGLEWR